MNLNPKRKFQCVQTIKQELKKRMLTGKKTWLTLEEKEDKIKSSIAERDDYEL